MKIMNTVTRKLFKSLPLIGDCLSKRKHLALKKLEEVLNTRDLKGSNS